MMGTGLCWRRNCECFGPQLCLDFRHVLCCLALDTYFRNHLLQSKLPLPPFSLPSQREAMYFNKGHIILKWSVTIQREEEWVRVRVRGRCFTNWPGENILQSKLSSKYWGTYYITSLTPRSSPFFFCLHSAYAVDHPHYFVASFF